MLSESKLDKGWGFDPYTGAIFHFEHYSKVKAEHQMLQKKWAFVVETINWTIAHNNQKMVHRNQYFALSLVDAIAIAVKKQFDSLTAAEDLLRIRPATIDESIIYDKVYSHYYGKANNVLTESEVAELPDSDLSD